MTRSTAGGDSQMTVNVGETIEKRKHDGGPVVSRVSDVEPGESTKVVEVTARTLRDAVDTDLQDSYKSVHIWCDGETTAVTDHWKPIEGEDSKSLNAFTEKVARTDVIEPTSDAVRTAVGRSYVRAALAEFDKSETIRMFVDEDWPLVLVGEEKSVGIAPIASPDDLPDRTGGAIA